MRLTKHTDFALRILVYSAMEAGDRLLSVQEVTDAFQVPRTHVMKIVQKLGQLGYLQTFRGKGGGFRLGMQPEDINLGEVVKVMETSITLVECEEIACIDCSTCQLKDIMNQAMEAFFNVLNQYTLTDAMNKKNDLLIQLQAG